MTAIAAVVRRHRGAPGTTAHLRSLRAALTPLGRDGSTALDLGPVGFVHCHSGGFTPHDQYDQQPIRLAEGRLTVVVVGRVDNRDEIARHLSLAAPESERLADSDLIGRLWERDGLGGLRRIVGPFVAIGWDQRNGEVVAVRDPLGQRTLHLHDDGDHLILSSSPTGIHACGVERQIDRIKLVDSLLLDYSEDERTFFEGISRLPAGHLLRTRPDESHHRVELHHDLFDVEPLRLSSDDDYLDAAREVFDTACRATLRTTATPSIALSGGLDSILVAAKTSPLLGERGERLRAFTSVPAHPVPTDTKRLLDESPLVRAFVALHPEIDHTFLTSDSRGLYDHLDAVIAAGGHPPRNAANLYWIHEIAERTRAAGANVWLTGGGGNATLGWAGNGLLRAQLRQRRFRDLARELVATGRRDGTKAGAGLVWRELVAPALPGRALIAVDRMRGNHRHWSEHSALQLVPEELTAAEHRLSERGVDPTFRLTPSDPRRRMLDAASTTAGEFHNVFLAVHGAETRDPTIDRRVVEFSLAIPADQYRRHGVDRWLQRRMLADTAPDQVVRARRRGKQAADFGARLLPHAPLIEQDLNDAADDDVLRAVLDLGRLRRTVADAHRWPDGPTDPNVAKHLLALSRAVATIRFVEQTRDPVAAVPAVDDAEQRQTVKLGRTAEPRHPTSSG